MHKQHVFFSDKAEEAFAPFSSFSLRLSFVCAVAIFRHCDDL
jgi:hypothetical protein